MLRLAPEAALGRHFSELLPSLRRDSSSDTLQLLEIGGRTLAVTRNLETPVGRQRAVVVLRDVSDVLDIERLKRDIIQTVSHELRTPLTAIRATVDLFETGDAGNLSDVQLRMVGLLSRNTDRLLTIVNDLLALSALEGRNVTLTREPIDLAVMASRVTEDLGPAATAGNVTLETEAPNPAVAWGDEQRLRHVLENLVQNGIKFGRPGGQVIVEVIDGAYEVTVRVRDNGIGITPEDHDRVFEKFYRTQAGQRITGSGLGLPIAKLLVELHGGRIWVESDGQTGSVVSYTVPAAPSP
jgi:signal transduction histidine kinase